MFFRKDRVILNVYVLLCTENGGVTVINKVAGYRRMLGKTQKDMAKEFNISSQAYWNKEKGKAAFSDKEKIHFKKMLQTIFPDITIDEIFFE